jgi:adenylate cyclase
MSSLPAVASIVAEVAAAEELEVAVALALRGLAEGLGFDHALLFVREPESDHLVALASHGYDRSGAGAEVAFDEGVAGSVAKNRRSVVLRASELNYVRAIQENAARSAKTDKVIPVPASPNVAMIFAAPMIAGDQLIGAVVCERDSILVRAETRLLALEVVAAHLGAVIASFRTRIDDNEEEPAPDSPPAAATSGEGRVVWHYRADDSVFVDGEYLIKGVAGAILAKLLKLRRDEGRTAFTNRELRLDASLGLPPVNDSLESRLLLLRKRLQDNDVGVRLPKTGRGLFELVVEGAFTLEER